MKRCATSTIRLALAPEIKYDVFEETKPKESWGKLEKMFQSKSLASNFLIRTYSIWISKNESIDFEISHQHIQWIDIPIGKVG